MRTETMASSKKSKKEEKGKEKRSESNGSRKANGRNTKKTNADGKSKTVKTKKKRNEMNGEAAVEEPEVFEISDTSIGDSEKGVEEERQRSNGGGKSRKGEGGRTPKKRRREEEEEEEEVVVEDGDGVEEAKICRFPMNRIRRIMRSEESASQIMQEAVFLVNKATEMFIEQFSEDAYECSVLDRKKFLHYKHLSSVVSNEKRYEFLSDFVPEKIKAKDALEQRKSAMADAG